MSHYDRPILVYFLGLPGSGKSHFARQLADELNAIRLNSDSMRLSIFESREVMDEIYNSNNRQIINSYVFNAMDYVTEQILIRNQDVIYDANSNRRSDRESLEAIAKLYNAIPILVCMNTPDQVAHMRGQARNETIDQRKLSKEKMTEVMDRHRAGTDYPVSTENVVEIDGQIDFNEQFKVFHAYTNKLAYVGVHD